MLITERITVGGFPAKLSTVAKGIGFTVEPNLVIGGSSGAVIAPVFTTQPVSQSVDEYGTATFTAVATNADTLQFYKRGVAVGSPSSTGSATYSFVTSGIDNAASVYCVATKGAQSTQSDIATLTVISYAFNFDGVTQYAPLSATFPLLIGDLLYVDFRAPTVPQTDFKAMIARHANYGGLIQFGSTNTWSFSRGTLKVDNLDVTGSTPLPNDGIMHTAELTVTSATEISAIGCQWSTVGTAALRFFDKELYNIRVVRSGVTVFRLPMNNKPAGAVQPSSSAITATIVNYNAAGWVPV